jgi:hypothetical protein
MAGSNSLPHCGHSGIVQIGWGSPSLSMLPVGDRRRLRAKRWGEVQLDIQTRSPWPMECVRIAPPLPSTRCIQAPRDKITPYCRRKYALIESRRRTRHLSKTCASVNTSKKSSNPTASMSQMAPVNGENIGAKQGPYRSSSVESVGRALILDDVRHPIVFVSQQFDQIVDRDDTDQLVPILTHGEPPDPVLAHQIHSLGETA